ncbi:MAG: hypothetical protein M1816_007403 [Peltula sp. TS41687]|nr:MAG: hypothetical protein M1816_007403 [Peltula sp. TS41687]
MEGMMMQSIFGSSPVLFKRQGGPLCEVGSSPCPAVNATGCCANDSYCYVNPIGEAKCCERGSDCDDYCPKSAYRCTLSSTFTTCPQSLGGYCCGIGSICLPGTRCSPTSDPKTVNTVSASPTGSAGNPASATGSSTSRLPDATRSSSSSNDTGGGGAGGLSQGAKAGISASVTLVGLLFLAFIVWYICARRRQRKRKAAAAAAAVTTPLPDGGPGISQLSSPGGASSRLDYFSPDATQGPFTQVADSTDSRGMRAYNAPRAVPLTPQGPGDITAPVEIGVSNQLAPEQTTVQKDDRGHHTRREFDHRRMDSIQGRVELP